jgi:DNA polymerase
MQVRNESKISRIQRIAEEIRNCRRCGLSETRINAVPGEGNADSSLVLIGEAPGYWEDRRGRPFVGAAGKVLDESLEKVGIRRPEIFITNVLKCRPPGNRDPRSEEVRACTPYLDSQLEIIRPKFIVTLGRHATSYIFSRIGLEFDSISKVHGRIYEARFEGWISHVMPTFHPAAALYNVNVREKLISDLQLLKRRMESTEEPK